MYGAAVAVLESMGGRVGNLVNLFGAGRLRAIVHPSFLTDGPISFPRWSEFLTSVLEDQYRNASYVCQRISHRQCITDCSNSVHVLEIEKGFKVCGWYCQLSTSYMRRSSNFINRDFLYGFPRYTDLARCNYLTTAMIEAQREPLVCAHGATRQNR